MPILKAYSQKNNFEETISIKKAPGLNQCPLTSAIEVIGGKWKVMILYQLRGKTLRFGELKKIIPKITQKMLSQQLRELEKNKLVIRKVYAQVPPKVEYTSTELAHKLNPALDMLCRWGSEYQKIHAE
jgi:DNA-binding HxlR family transcriptional regulator